MPIINLKKITGKAGLPWYILDESSGQLITSPTIPVSISDTKEILFAESAVPGLNYTPLYPNRNGNTTLSFSLPIINRLSNFGNLALMQQFEKLRNQDTPPLSAGASALVRGDQFRSNPTVIYSWGTHRPPLRFYVTKCDFEHTSSMTNRAGISQYTIVSMELKLDENNALYRMYVLGRLGGSLAGMGQGISEDKKSLKGSRPY